MDRHIQFSRSSNKVTPGDTKPSFSGFGGTTFFYASMRIPGGAGPVRMEAKNKYLFFVLNGRQESKWQLVDGVQPVEVPAYAFRSVVLEPGAAEVRFGLEDKGATFSLQCFGFSLPAVELLSEDFHQFAALWTAAGDDPLMVHALPPRFLPPTMQKYMDRLRNTDKKGFRLNIHRMETLYQLVAKYHALLLQASAPRLSVADDAGMLRRAIDLIDQHFSDPDFTVDKLAEEIGLSRRNLYRLFESHGHPTPQRAIVNARLEKASELLKQNLSVREVTAIVGFNHPPHFATLYKQAFGVSPKDDK